LEFPGHSEQQVLASKATIAGSPVTGAVSGQQEISAFITFLSRIFNISTSNNRFVGTSPRLISKLAENGTLHIVMSALRTHWPVPYDNLYDIESSLNFQIGRASSVGEGVGRAPYANFGSNLFSPD